MTQHHALFIFDRSGSIFPDSFRKSAEWMDFDAKLWANQFEGFFVYAGDHYDLSIPRDLVAVAHTSNTADGPRPSPSAALDAWARAHGRASADIMGGGGGDIFAQTLLATDIAQSKLPPSADARISRICIFSDFYDPPPKAADFEALKLSLTAEYFRDVELTLCAIAESDPKHTADWARAATPFFRQVQTVHVQDYLDARDAHDEATLLAKSIPIKKKRAAKPNRAASI